MTSRRDSTKKLISDILSHDRRSSNITLSQLVGIITVASVIIGTIYTTVYNPLDRKIDNVLSENKVAYREFRDSMDKINNSISDMKFDLSNKITRLDTEIRNAKK